MSSFNTIINSECFSYTLNLCIWLKILFKILYSPVQIPQKIRSCVHSCCQRCSYQVFLSAGSFRIAIAGRCKFCPSGFRCRLFETGAWTQFLLHASYVIHSVNVSGFRSLGDHMSLLRWVPTACDHLSGFLACFLWRLGMYRRKCEGAQNWGSCLSLLANGCRGMLASEEVEYWALRAKFGV